MKVSKVNHVKTAVGSRSSNEFGGFLYQDLKQEGSVIEPEKYVEDLVNSTKKIYSIIGPLNSREKKGGDQKSIAKVFQKINKEYRCQNYSVAVLKKERINLQDKEKLKNIKMDPVDFLSQKIKRSLRKSEVLDSLVKLFRYVFYEDENLQLSDEQLKYLSQELCRDYTHDEARKTVEKSILNQDMPVQPSSKNMIQLPAKKVEKEKRKAEEREALNDFLLHYADLTMIPNTPEKDKKAKTLKYSVRYQYLIQLRRLVQLYFYGPEKVNQQNDFDVWKDHAICRDNRELFLTDFETDRKDKNGKQIKSCGKKDYREFEERIGKLDGLLQEKANSDKELNQKIKDQKRDVKEISIKILLDIRSQNIHAYRRSARYINEHPDLFLPKSSWNLCFLRLIESEVEHLFQNFDQSDRFKLQKGYLSEKAWKYLLNYLSVKYISIGKAVYHYACNEFGGSDNIELGKMDVSKINSFDYEMIKAEEDLQRKAAVYIAFAVQNFAQNAFEDDYRMSTVEVGNRVEGKDDVLLYDLKDIQGGRKKDALRGVLQFFGGKSKWQNLLLDEKETDKFLLDLKNMLYFLRNRTFHFHTASTDSVTWNQDRILDMLKHEIREGDVIRRKMYYSNNLWMFYDEKQLGYIMSDLYQKEAVRGVQVPSYKNVLGRKALAGFLREIGIKSLQNQSEEIQEKLHSALYFLLKEIYYQKFLAEPTLKDDFVKKLKSRQKELEKEHQKDKKQEKEALDDFLGQLDDLEKLKNSDGPAKGLTFSKICEFYMTEYNAQNQNQRVVQSTKSQKKHPKIYRHYKMILYYGIYEAFKDYMKEHYPFLQNPHYNENNIEFDKFLPDWTSTIYQNVLEDARQSPELQCWYICSRFLPPRQVNHLSGVFRNYLQYVENIKRRASQNNQKLTIQSDLTEGSGLKLIEMLDFTRLLAGKIFGKFDDYFDHENDEPEIVLYSNYISKFVDQDDMQKERENLLNDNEKSGKYNLINDPYKVYIDEANPILNRNVIFAKLFAPTKVMENAIEKIKYDEYKEYQNLKEQYPRNLIRGGATKLSEQKKINDFRDAKNRVELLNLYEYAELIIELQGNLVSWSYLRERDMMYFMLGFHYMCLHNADSEHPSGYMDLMVSESRNIRGAVLHQILSIFIYGYPIYGVQDNGSWDQKDLNCKMAMSSKIMKFDSAYPGVFDAGKELFQVLSEEKRINELRDYIDHFKYFVRSDRSLLDLYSEVFDRFFTYDQKLRKNVPNVLTNILARHFILVKGLRFENGKKTDDGGKNMALIRFDDLISDDFTYRLIDDIRDEAHPKEKPVDLPAKGEKFLEDVKSILEYSDPR